MSHLLHYVAIKGEHTFFQAPVSPVDALILSTLSYIQFDHLISEYREEAPTLLELFQVFQELPKEARENRFRHAKDEELLQLMGESKRFGALHLTAAKERLDEEKELQFAAITLLLEDGGALVAFRGTDGTLTGWKEDLNLSFLDVIPGQCEAKKYLEKIARICQGDLYVAGHSKGGNLAVYAAVQSRDDIKERIKAVYNYDGPGFRQKMLEEPGYRELLTRIHTFVPQSSVVGMLLEHEEPYTVIFSTEEGLLQHEPYTWEISGDGFVKLSQVTESSRMVDETIKKWLNGLSIEERRTFIDALYEVLKSSDAKRIEELTEPKNILAILQKLGQEDEKTRRMLTETLLQLAKAAIDTLSGEVFLPGRGH